MKKIKKPLNLLIIYTEKLHNIIKELKKNMRGYVLLLLKFLIFFINMNMKVKLNFFSKTIIKFQPRT